MTNIQGTIVPLDDFEVQEKADLQNEQLLPAYDEDALQVCQIISVIHKYITIHCFVPSTGSQ